MTYQGICIIKNNFHTSEDAYEKNHQKDLFGLVRKHVLLA